MAAAAVPLRDAYGTLFDPDITITFGKVSCMRGAFFAHVVFCYLLVLSGAGAFIARMVPAFTWMHRHFGRAYIVSMLWATATALIIHNTGLPAATLVSFIWALGGMCLAWALALFHDARMHAAALAEVQAELKAAGGLLPPGALLADHINAGEWCVFIAV